MCKQIYILLCGFQSTNSDRFSSDGYEDPPVPISNTVVKLINAESTWLETAWEDRKLLINEKKKVYRMVGLFLFAHLRLANPARTVSSQGCRSIVYVYLLIRWRGKSRAVEDGGVKRRQIHCITFFRT